MTTEIDIDAVRAAAGSTRDPEIRRSLGELGLLDEVQVVDGQVTVHFHLTSPLCPTKFATSIGQDIRRRVEAIPGVTSCEVVLQPPRFELKQKLELLKRLCEKCEGPETEVSGPRRLLADQLPAGHMLTAGL